MDYNEQGYHAPLNESPMRHGDLLFLKQDQGQKCVIVKLVQETTMKRL